MRGRKYDAGKPEWHLLPLFAVEEIVRVLTYGARKYAPDNWKKVPGARTRYYDAAIRHIVAYKQGEEKDRESGYHHLAHAACCLLYLLQFDLTNTEPPEEELEEKDAALARKIQQRHLDFDYPDSPDTPF